MTEETKTEKKTTKTRGAKRDPAVIEKELEERLAKLREKKRLASTPGLKLLREAREKLGKAVDESRGSRRDVPIAAIFDQLNGLIEEMEK